ncbi:hypothetical protein BCR43DRAFT_493022 [Syncephalastrum racemosum]|uniref:Uncharacterized protein n=1 Tax=Syncephalastrum racemosum TaxID=13706 RepID=A0A1X2H9X9_SYNRA|nr:hypothetical protein BCR43DRAFT_493022 [Syncephalastrum racemosum]
MRFQEERVLETPILDLLHLHLSVTFLFCLLKHFIPQLKNGGHVVWAEVRQYFRLFISKHEQVLLIPNLYYPLSLSKLRIQRLGASSFFLYANV